MGITEKDISGKIISRKYSREKRNVIQRKGIKKRTPKKNQKKVIIEAEIEKRNKKFTEEKRQ